MRAHNTPDPFIQNYFEVKHSVDYLERVEGMTNELASLIISYTVHWEQVAERELVEVEAIFPNRVVSEFAHYVNLLRRWLLVRRASVVLRKLVDQVSVQS